MFTYKILTSRERNKETEITTASTIEPSILATMIPRARLDTFESDSIGLALYLTMDGEIVLDTNTALVTKGASDMRKYALLHPNWHRVIFVTGDPALFTLDILKQLRSYIDVRVLKIPLKRFQRLVLKNDRQIVIYANIIKQLLMVMGIQLHKDLTTGKGGSTK